MQLGFDPELIDVDTDGTSVVLTVIVTGPELAEDAVAQIALDVRIQVTTSLFDKEEEV